MLRQITPYTRNAQRRGPAMGENATGGGTAHVDSSSEALPLAQSGAFQGAEARILTRMEQMLRAMEERMHKRMEEMLRLATERIRSDLPDLLQAKEEPQAKRRKLDGKEVDSAPSHTDRATQWDIDIPRPCESEAQDCQQFSSISPRQWALNTVDRPPSRPLSESTISAYSPRSAPATPPGHGSSQSPVHHQIDFVEGRESHQRPIPSPHYGIHRGASPLTEEHYGANDLEIQVVNNSGRHSIELVEEFNRDRSQISPVNSRKLTRFSHHPVRDTDHRQEDNINPVYTTTNVFNDSSDNSLSPNEFSTGKVNQKTDEQSKTFEFVEVHDHIRPPQYEDLISLLNVLSDKPPERRDSLEARHVPFLLSTPSVALRPDHAVRRSKMAMMVNEMEERTISDNPRSPTIQIKSNYSLPSGVRSASASGNVRSSREIGHSSAFRAVGDQSFEPRTSRLNDRYEESTVTTSNLTPEFDFKSTDVNMKINQLRRSDDFHSIFSKKSHTDSSTSKLSVYNSEGSNTSKLCNPIHCSEMPIHNSISNKTITSSRIVRLSNENNPREHKTFGGNHASNVCSAPAITGSQVSKSPSRFEFISYNDPNHHLPRITSVSSSEKYQNRNRNDTGCTRSNENSKRRFDTVDASESNSSNQFRTQDSDQYSSVRLNNNHDARTRIVTEENEKQISKSLTLGSTVDEEKRSNSKAVSKASSIASSKAPSRASAPCSRRIGPRELQWALIVAASDGRTDAVRRLLAAGVELTACDPEGCTALHWAARRGRADIVKLLLEAGANLEARDRVGWTPLHCAAAYDPAGDCVSQLLDAGAPVDARSNAAMTPLHLAALYANAGTAKALLAAGASRTARDAHKRTPVMTARTHALVRILRG